VASRIGTDIGIGQEDSITTADFNLSYWSC
jgi:hypothetical protein